MYCTIPDRQTSTGLGDDARCAYHRFRRRARALGAISSSFDALANDLTAAYFVALSEQVPVAWADLVMRSDVMVKRAHALRGIIVLSAEEREALDFFAAIARENADLLALPEPIPAVASAEPRLCVSA